MRRRALTVGFGLLLCAAAALAGALRVPQDAKVRKLPEELQQFWRDYTLAKDADDEEGMDKAVRRNHERAVRTLDLLIEDYCTIPKPDMPEELRTLAFTLGRVDGHQRYIDRVRFVLELPADLRPRRSEGIYSMNAAIDLYNKAEESNNPDDWAAALAAFQPVLQRWVDLEDAEQAVICLEYMALCEAARGRTAEQAALLQQLLEQGARLNYKDETVAKARITLEDLTKAGVEASSAAAAPAASEPAAEAAPAPGGGLHAFEAGSAPIELALRDDKGSKGVGAVSLPGFYQPEQYLLWSRAWVETGAPDAFDDIRAVQLKPFGAGMTVERDGSKFQFDVNGDGTVDLSAALSNTPQRYELPAPDGKGFYPVMLAIPGDREDMFGVATNSSPSKEGANIRFAVGGALEVDALGSAWKLYDTNLSGVWGDAAAKYGNDGVTAYDPALENIWLETDSVLIGKAKAAIPWSTALPVGEDFYRAEIKDNRTLTLQKLSLPVGQLKLDAASAVPPSQLVLYGTGPIEGAFFNVVPAKKGGTVTLPAGIYRIASGAIESGKKTSMKFVRIYQGRSTEIEVKPGETTTLAIGAPYKLAVGTATQEGAGIIGGTTIRVFGRAGEEYAMLFDDPLQPDVEVRTQSGKKLVKGDRMARAGVEDYEKNRSTRGVDLWFPVDYAFELPGGESFQVRLTQEKHPLLGGPFDSDWTP